MILDFLYWELLIISVDKLKLWMYPLIMFSLLVEKNNHTTTIKTINKNKNTTN